jgi:hypothetical protein
MTNETSPAAVRTRFTLDGTLTIQSLVIRQSQCLAEEYVLTRLGGTELLFIRERGARYIVDRTRRVLLPVGTAPAPAESTLARVELSVDRESHAVDGYECRRFTVCSEAEQLSISGEAYYAAIPGLERTALHVERVRNAAPELPTHLLAPDEVLIRASTLVRSPAGEQRQTYQLNRVCESAVGRDADDPTGYRIARAVTLDR